MTQQRRIVVKRSTSKTIREKLMAITTCSVCNKQIISPQNGIWLNDKKAMIHKACK